jgi:hypothetical protein
MTEDNLRKQLYGSFKNRAMMYYYIFEELQKDFGEEKAVEVMKRGIYRRGLEIGRQFKKFAPADLQGLKKAFFAIVPDEGRMFDPEVLRCDADVLEIKMRRCPLKDAWLETGLSDQQTARMCDIAAVVDNGTFEGAGFKFTAITWNPGQEGCCLLKIMPNK